MMNNTIDMFAQEFVEKNKEQIAACVQSIMKAAGEYPTVCV